MDKMRIFAMVYIMSLSGLFSQEKVLDTIYANRDMMVGVSFGSPIMGATCSTARFSFDFDGKTPQTMGFLRADKGAMGNLWVRTKDGSIYCLVLGYMGSLERLHYVIASESAVIPSSSRDPERGVESPEKVLVTKGKGMSGGPDLTTLEKNCQALLRLPERLDLGDRNGGFSFKVTNWVYGQGLVYLQISVSNRSGVDFVWEQLKLFRSARKVVRRAITQDTEIVPIYIHGQPKTIGQGGEARVVLVLPRFVMGKGESMRLDLWEPHGRRLTVKLRAPHFTY
ncbi:DUF4138 domain-containing protein [Sediminicola luteus]|uniref:DUF4138 domain-containing protein n=1 Tax=Sediminicola luteus TaxID=319238 RepID=A0A2A4G5I3_9FLAO|nr:DUF4138 domain-containing protein [Sediminicola luteus]PCE63005.1 hypothetical protein B7P33_17170 [Sediminicola luteus]